MSNGNGLSPLEFKLLQEVRDDVKRVILALADKVNLADFHRLEEQVGKIDRDGSHGLLELKEITSVNSARIDSLVGWRNRLYGMLALVAFLLPLLATISWHIWS